ncbi:MAG: hypothetical protein NC548_27235 [Lachnospiraceae bacterium]|nr:hypothetical protein [Lachnospiraceae bacterium]
MINVAKYTVNLYLNGNLIGDIREHAQNLEWTRKRTKIGVDSISFSLNDVQFAKWCAERNTDIATLLKPLALTCRISRNGTPVVGGFLATMPSYTPQGGSATLTLSFDGYINYLAGVHFIPPYAIRGTMGQVVQNWVEGANTAARIAGKEFGFITGSISTMAEIEETFDSYKDYKSAITDRCDNTTGAGPFELYFHPNMTYDVIKDSEFGEEITDYIIEYPMLVNTVSATSISAKEVTGFASMVMGIGAEEANDSGEAGNLYTAQLNQAAVVEYGYCEKVFQQSSVSQIATLQRNVATELKNVSTMQWQPELKLTGRTVNPVPTGERKIWIGDTVTIQNNEDLTGMTSGKFRVNALKVKVEDTGAEEITPTISRSEAVNTSSFAKDIVRIEQELLDVQTGANRLCVLG